MCCGLWPRPMCLSCELTRCFISSRFSSSFFSKFSDCDCARDFSCFDISSTCLSYCSSTAGNTNTRSVRDLPGDRGAVGIARVQEGLITASTGGEHGTA